MLFGKTFEKIRKDQTRRESLEPKLIEMRGGDAESPKNISIQGDEESASIKVYLYDVIGWPFIEAQDLVYTVPEDIKRVDLYINSPGGDAIEGMAIFNFLDQHPADVQVHVTGLAASAASLIASVGPVEMSKASFWMIHNAWVLMIGDAESLRKEADFLDKIGDVYADVYVQKTGKTKAQILQWMKDTTYFSPQEALDAGFADSITGQKSEPQDRFNLAVFDRSNGQTFGRAAGVRSDPKQSAEDDMNKKLRAMLVKKGMDPNATDDQAWAFLAKLENLTDAEKAEIENLKAAPQSDPAQPPAPSQEIIDKAAQEAVKAERERMTTIRENCRIAGLDDAAADGMIQEGLTVEQATQKIFTKMAETNPPLGAGRFQTGEHDQDKFRAAVTDGQCMRGGVRLQEPAPGAEEFRGATIQRVALECLERAGVPTRKLRSGAQIAGAILHHARHALSTDDFTSIFLDAQHKSLQRAYQESPRTFGPIVTVTSASDFKTIYGISLSEMPDLDLIKEDQEYKHAALSDKQETYAVKKYGKLIRLTREMIINDDLRAFLRIPMLFGAAAARKESDIVWALITGNPTMADGYSLFSADHSNLESSTTGTITAARLQNGRKAMRVQTGLGGATIDVSPSYVIVPTAQETDTEVLVRSAANPGDNKNARTYNPWNTLTPIAEPRLDANSVKAWYLAADPGQVDIIEMAYLDGRQEPYTEENPEFVTDAIAYKIRHEFGAQVMDHRGLWKNPGE